MRGRPNGQGEWKTTSVAELQNATFEEYYKTQGIVPEAEWDQFLGALKTELPTTFRVTGSRAHADTINNLIKDVYVPTMQEVELEGVRYEPPKPIVWYPGQIAWEISAPKRVVRKNEWFKKFQKFLVGETDVGNLSRQEAVSMIPPLLMDVEPHHRCLDMCAAPGSKTAQIIEALNPYHTESTGLLIANDADYKRTHMLVHQTGRMPSKGLLVTNCDASMFPNISLGNNETLKFDRILADVPCSGDGTMRKNMEIWKKWMPSDGNSLHIIQLRILHRAMNMLKPGGRLVYSTCSFNPSENEAVVAAALNAHPGEFSIVDVSDKLPGLKRRPGITSWKVGTNGLEGTIYHESYETYMATREGLTDEEKRQKKELASTLWAPENAGELNLERALRLLPHDQNTGGFFVCVLEKAGQPVATSAPKVDIDALPEMGDVEATDEKGSLSLKRALSPSAEGAEGTEPQAKKAKAPGQAPKKKERPDLAFREDPFSFVDPSHEEVGIIADWFGLTESFPRNNLLVRNADGSPHRTIYIASDLVKAIVENNDYTRLRMISAGIKSFIRQDSQARTDIPCKWRVSGDGIDEVLKYVPDERVVKATVAELFTFLENMYPPIDSFKPPFKTHLEAAQLGNMLVRFAAGEDEASGGKLALPLDMPVWKAKQSMSLLIDKREKSVLSNRVFGRDICNPVPFVKGSNAGTEASSTAVSGTATPATEGEEATVNAPALESKLKNEITGEEEIKEDAKEV
jgi:multisite-specific tRNA:(cytosine-C5)-methyltransferase